MKGMREPQRALGGEELIEVPVEGGANLSRGHRRRQAGGIEA